jgi:hypothetical protein
MVKEGGAFAIRVRATQTMVLDTLYIVGNARLIGRSLVCDALGRTEALDRGTYVSASSRINV